MADVKWIKINTDIFDDEKFKLIDSMPESDAIELIWFKLLVFAGRSNNNGIFFFNNRVAYTDEMLASVFNRPLATVRLAINTFMDLEMVSEIDGIYTITNWEKHQSISDAYENKKERDREYSKKYREKQKLLIEESKGKTKKNEKSSDESSDADRLCSYSNSKSNIFNLNYLLNTDTNYNYINSNTELKELIEDWLEYKDSKGKHHLHYVEKSMRALLSRFIEYHCKYGLKPLKEAVDKTITNGWVGIVWESVHQTNNKNETTNADWLEKWRNA